MCDVSCAACWMRCTGLWSAYWCARGQPPFRQAVILCRKTRRSPPMGGDYWAPVGWRPVHYHHHHHHRRPAPPHPTAQPVNPATRPLQ